jgi:hypothetical protein
MDTENVAHSDEADQLSSPDTSPTPRASGGRKAPKKLGQAVPKRAVQQTTRTIPDPGQQQQELQRTLAEQDDEESAIAQNPTRGRRIVPVRQSRIQDRPAKVGEKDSSLKIKIELDLEVEVELYARVKGDITIGLM